ncbi:hypothetical protein Y032_0080g1308 [Ancylostoma ceylanicum]|uniref:Uncharacterized protein n=1 Tax=Ancylostoma ceylanicum TaxID=53326 RepID=A0A016TSC7_9BILA|nr:hypothetical protein Y032_0080g1308 [Ancylostoma ceylanicum]
MGVYHREGKRGDFSELIHKSTNLADPWITRASTTITREPIQSDPGSPWPLEMGGGFETAHGFCAVAYITHFSRLQPHVHCSRKLAVSSIHVHKELNPRAANPLDYGVFFGGAAFSIGIETEPAQCSKYGTQRSALQRIPHRTTRSVCRRSDNCHKIGREIQKTVND